VTRKEFPRSRDARRVAVAPGSSVIDQIPDDLTHPIWDALTFLDRIADVFPRDILAKCLNLMAHVHNLTDFIAESTGADMYDVSSH
jgi:hypothetical protein